MEEQHLAALEVRVDADLAAGRHAELIGELQQLTSQHPWRERLHAQLMLALYRSGRQADALEAYRHAREVLVEQLGIEPGAELHDLHEAILAHDPAIDAPHPPRPTAGAPGRGRVPHVARAAESHDRSRARARRDRRAAANRFGPAVDADRAWRGRQDAARARGRACRRGATFLTARTSSRSLPCNGPRTCPRRSSRRSERRPLRRVARAGARALPRRQATAAGRRQLRAPARRRAVHRRPAGRLPRAHRARDQPRAAALQAEGATRSATRCPPIEAPCRRRRRHAVLRARTRARSRVRASDGNATAVAEICRRVDGLPLAIELAAARCALLSPGEIAERLDVALGALGAGARDAPARQQTLRATIDWSHALLSDDEKACFARFAVFAGGATVEAAEAITGAGLDTLDRLVVKSLLVRRRHAHAPTRLTMLETIRAYATERFAAAADADAVRERHYRYYLALAQRHGDRTGAVGDGRKGASRQARRRYRQPRTRPSRWAIGQANAERALAMVAALGRYWVMRGRYVDAVDWVDQALNLPGADAHPALRVRALCTKARCLWAVGRGAEQRAVVATAVAIARRLGDPLILAQALQLSVFTS